MGMPPMDMPKVDGPTAPGDVLVGGAAPPSGSEVDPNTIQGGDSGSQAEGKKRGLFGLGMFGS